MANFAWMDKIEALSIRNPDALIQVIGQRLRRQRLAKGWTQKELAERAGVSLSTLKLMEHEGKGSLQRLAKVAVALGIDGDLRALFSGQRSFESLEAVERITRLRAPRRKIDHEQENSTKKGKV
ncbi:MAG: helix-turn-helix transcriptional regulator [Verrucomicrobiae bacterium]|nr:helix-turn-helix transcriptional regulator [Verrucomicrobiae bacterium]NNJ42992.1 helix-turn-helix transcriptional regulator [Akkermansiaceae bacterium]